MSIKFILLIHLLIILMVYGCREFKGKTVQRFIPGTYIRFSEHEFGTEYDTLVIRLQNLSAHEYNITRKWRYERIQDDGSIIPEYKSKKTTGIYDETSLMLQEVQTLHLYSFDVKKKLLFKGPIKYYKL